MAIVDERGRLGGRVNLIDAVVAFLILVLIPVAFGAYLLFRTPPATLTAVVPAKLYQGSNLRVEVQGENLRPFLRVSFDTLQGRTFMIGGTRGAIVELPDLEAGVYDVVLWDYMREVSRLPKALTILPLAPVSSIELEVTGAFRGLSIDRVPMLKAGDKLPAHGTTVAEVVSVGAKVVSGISVRAGEALLHVPIAGQMDLPAVLIVHCYVVPTSGGALRCAVPGPVQQADVAPGSALSLATPNGWAMFQIDQVRAPAPQPATH